MIVLDVAGSVMGGSRRFADLAVDHCRRRSDVEVIGYGEPLSPGHLASRERVVSQKNATAISANNLSFVLGPHRTVILRNALDFLSPTEHERLRLPTRRSATTLLVRTMSRRANVIVVPSSSMAERVECYLPGLSDRIRVRPHPVQPADRPIERDDGVFRVLVPTLPARHRLFGDWFPVVAEAARSHSLPIELMCTFEPDDELDVDNATYLGRLSLAQLDSVLETVDAVLYPGLIESFGYPLAEARVRGIPALSADSALAKEVAGDSLVPCDLRSVTAMCDAFDAAIHKRKVLPASPGAFDPERYFERLFTCEKV